MDDDELSQDVLDQFDLVCTQYSSNFTGKVRHHSHMEGMIESEKSSLNRFRLSRTASCDTDRTATFAAQSEQPVSNSMANNHIVKLKQEMKLLREELYMKIGELSSLKESSNRNTNSRLEIIRKLETQLTSEREESRKTVTALNSQLAFREADYQLVSHELAQIKDLMLSSQATGSEMTSHKEHSVLLTQVTSNTSPASALLASINTPKNVTPSGQPLRISFISPGVNTTTSRKRRRIWSDEIDRASPSPSPTITKQGVKVMPLNLRAVPPRPLPEKDEEGSSRHTPCKRNNVKEIVGNPELPEKMLSNLRYRLHRRNVLSKSTCGRLSRIAGDMSRLSIKTGCLPPNPAITRTLVDVDDIERVSVDSNFFEGLSVLSSTTFDSLDLTERINRSIPLFLPRIRKRFQEYVSFFLRYRLGMFNQSICGCNSNEKRAALSEYGAPTCALASSTCADVTTNLTLNEDPFAGALASQAVPVLTDGKARTMNKSPLTKSPEDNISEANSWVDVAANHATEGMLACLHQISVLILRRNQYQDIDIRGLASFMGETVTAFAKIFSPSTSEKEQPVNELPDGWMGRLTSVVEVALFITSSIAFELGKEEHIQRLDIPSWPPTLLGVFLLTTHTLSPCRPTLHSPLSPTLRLLSLLMQGRHLPPLEHQLTQDTTTHWWQIGNLDRSAVGQGLMSRLEVIGFNWPESRKPRMMTSSVSSSSLDSMSPLDRVGCPLLLLCGIVKFESSQTRRSDVEKFCSLLAEFAMFTSVLMSDVCTRRPTSCPCTQELYSTLIDLGVNPIDWLFRQSQITSQLTNVCLSALGCLIQALQSLLLAHGDQEFQAFTDRVPAFFSIISRLSQWSKNKTVAVDLIHPQLVEELHDFDSPQSGGPHSNSD